MWAVRASGRSPGRRVASPLVSVVSAIHASAAVLLVLAGAAKLSRPAPGWADLLGFRARTPVVRLVGASEAAAGSSRPVAGPAAAGTERRGPRRPPRAVREILDTQLGQGAPTPGRRGAAVRGDRSRPPEPVPRRVRPQRRASQRLCGTRRRSLTAVAAIGVAAAVAAGARSAWSP